MRKKEFNVNSSDTSAKQVKLYNGNNNVLKLCSQSLQ